VVLYILFNNNKNNGAQLLPANALLRYAEKKPGNYPLGREMRGVVVARILTIPTDLLSI
jgi:hypothetical protein